MSEPIYKAGPVYVDGEHVLTFLRDMFPGDAMVAEWIVYPDGTRPKAGKVLSHAEQRILAAMVDDDGITQDSLTSG